MGNLEFYKIYIKSQDACDIALLSENEESLKQVLNTMEQVSESYAIKINNTKIMACGADKQWDKDNRQIIRRSYLVSLISNKNLVIRVAKYKRWKTYQRNKMQYPFN